MYVMACCNTKTRTNTQPMNSLAELICFDKIGVCFKSLQVQCSKSHIRNLSCFYSIIHVQEFWFLHALQLLYLISLKPTFCIRTPHFL